MSLTKITLEMHAANGVFNDLAEWLRGRDDVFRYDLDGEHVAGTEGMSKLPDEYRKELLAAMACRLSGDDDGLTKHLAAAQRCRGAVKHPIEDVLEGRIK
jgi:hypothetical protein